MNKRRIHPLTLRLPIHTGLYLLLFLLSIYLLLLGGKGAVFYAVMYTVIALAGSGLPAMFRRRSAGGAK
ncbi:hypothetical protein [Paenibacillus sp. S150]|uniref:hypothetical protein n=1 Tax=Paenibacillus sp. S150 TaxID=2749826 RepID=UPI001C55C9A6|nr:hypothetical protein [Paenibacillus sp. S150]MBW4082374.1 hypothetical protein [Paenibacillus sp. S150]